MHEADVKWEELFADKDNEEALMILLGNIIFQKKILRSRKIYLGEA